MVLAFLLAERPRNGSLVELGVLKREWLGAANADESLVTLRTC